MSKRIVLVPVFLLTFSCLMAQNLPALEDSIATWHAVLAGEAPDSRKTEASQKMRALFTDVFTQDGVFDYPFSKLKFSTITSSDGRVRLFNWNQPYENGTSTYFCYVLEWNKKNQQLSVTELIDQSRDTEKIEQKYLTPEKWYGALYYEIIPMEKSKNNDTYTLLGWEAKDNLTTGKVIDAFTIKNGSVRLGAPVFKTEMGTNKRVFYEYSEDVSMSIKYDHRKKHIIFDHLSPRQPLMTGIYSDYGPDGTYDRFVLSDGKWEFEKEIDVSIYSPDDDRPYADPRRR